MTMSQWRTVIAAGTLAGILTVSAPSAAQIYKWTDASGTVHFSDNPPPRSASAPKVEVLPEIQYRPPPTRVPAPSEEPESSEPVAEAPPDQRGVDNADQYEPEQGDEDYGSDEPIVENAESDPAVRWRANSPRNRPGQPIRSVPRRR